MSVVVSVVLEAEGAAWRTIELWWALRGILYEPSVARMLPRWGGRDIMFAARSVVVSSMGVSTSPTWWLRYPQPNDRFREV